MSLPDPVMVLGVPVVPVTEDTVLHFVQERIAERRPARISTINVEFVVAARGDAEFARVLGESDLPTPDSAGILWALRRRKVPVSRRVGGSDLIWSISALAERRGYRIFLLGAQEGVAARAAEVLEDRYPSLEVAGVFAGSPSRQNEECIVDLIRRSRADILFVAFGAPQQDLWIARNLHTLGVSIALGVGGSFDYVAGTARRAPRWMQERGLEWAWRLARQPWRWKRMLALPRFAWLILRQQGPDGKDTE